MFSRAFETMRIVIQNILWNLVHFFKSQRWRPGLVGSIFSAIFAVLSLMLFFFIPSWIPNCLSEWPNCSRMAARFFLRSSGTFWSCYCPTSQSQFLICRPTSLSPASGMISVVYQVLLFFWYFSLLVMPVLSRTTTHVSSKHPFLLHLVLTQPDCQNR